MRAAATMTKGPGAIFYMPPEAMEEDEKEDNRETSKAKYDASIDVFSFGIVSIFTLSQTFPSNLLPTAYKKGGRLLARTELERRERYMRMIYNQLCEKHPLLLMIEGCLNFPEGRPSINDVLSLLEEAKTEVGDKQTIMNKLELLQTLQSKPKGESTVERDLESQLRKESEELQCNVQKLQQLYSSNQSTRGNLSYHVQVKEKEIVKVQQQLGQKEAQLANTKLELAKAKEGIKKEHEQRIETEALLKQRDMELVEIQQQLRRKGEQLRCSEAIVADFQNALQLRQTGTPGRKLIPRLCRKKTAPSGMARGSSTNDGQMVYFTPEGSNSVYRFDWSADKWEERLSCPYRNSGLVVIGGELTAVGGIDRFGYTNKLFALRQMKWVKEYPPMNTARSSPAVVCLPDSEYIVAIGGEKGGWTVAVELLQVNSKRWYKLTDLPKPLTIPSATLCGDVVHVIGAVANGYWCSPQALPSNDKPIPPQFLQHIISWKSLPPLPVAYSTAAILRRELIIVGGKQGWSRINALHQLVDGQWVKIGSMAIGRSECLVASLSPETIVIVGGYGAQGKTQDSVEECVV